MPAGWHDFAEIVPVSAATGDDVDRLERVLLEHLPEGEPLYPDDYLTDQPERALGRRDGAREGAAAHARRAAVLDRGGRSTSSRRPSGDDLLRLYCTILVERESQKPIVIGRGGEMIKRIGTEARQDLERFFGTKVFLDLRVKVNARLAQRRAHAR